MHLRQCDDIGSFIADVRASVITQDQRNDFDIYANEAHFGFSIVEEDINALPQGAEVLEIGAGVLLLNGYLVSRGIQAHALEPIGGGFSHFLELQNVVMRHYKKIGVQVDLIKSTIEDFSDTLRFDYVFSINVFEHIKSVEVGLLNAYSSLKHQGVLRIYCPNYRFPYEPHFNIPTLVNKRFTECLFKPTILKSSRVPEATETWNTLNWINPTQVKWLFVNRFGVKPIFNRLAAYQIMRRVLCDSQFSARRSRWVAVLLRVMDRIGLIHLFKFVPVTFGPVMDFKVVRVPAKG